MLKSLRIKGLGRFKIYYCSIAYIGFFEEILKPTNVTLDTVIFFILK